MAWQRKTELYIGVFKDEADLSSGFLVDGNSLHYEFEISRSTEFYKDTATFTIYNPNKDTTEQIMNNGRSVIFRAGYDDEKLGTLFVGQIGTAYVESESPAESKLVLVCKTQRGAQYQLQRTMMAGIVEKGKSYYDVLKFIADYAGIPVSGAEILKKNILDEDYVICGSIRDEVRNFIARKLRALGGTTIITNNEIVYLDKNNNAVFETVYLSYKSGLVSVKKKRDERYQSSEDAFEENREYYLGLKAMGDPEVAKQKALEANIKPKNIVDFTCLVNPSITVGAPVQIDAWRNENDKGAVQGLFFVTELKTIGDNFGGSYEMQGSAIEKPEAIGG